MLPIHLLHLSWEIDGGLYGYRYGAYFPLERIENPSMAEDRYSWKNLYEPKAEHEVYPLDERFYFWDEIPFER